MNKKQRIKLFERLQAKEPNPTTELCYQSNFELLVAVILSAQATDISVNKSTAKLFKVANTPHAILKLGVGKLKHYTRNIGLYNTKTNNIIKSCQILVNQYDSQVPDNREALESLPGVGRKTANVILNTAFGQPTIAVDTHIYRVANRTGLAEGNNVLKVEQALLKSVPKAYQLNAHHWLILHGRYTCTARQPKCGECIIFDVCEWGYKRI